MGIHTDKLTQSFRIFIETQPVFFVATAAPEGRVNLSAKGLNSLKIINHNQLAWLSVTGSGNETAAHLLESPRMTLMFCAFKGEPFTLRIYGDARAYHRHDAQWDTLYGMFPDYAGARNIFVLDIDLVTTSCGSGVPEMSLVRSRAETDLVPWFAEMGEDKIIDYWRKKNISSLDDKPTGIFDDMG